MYSSVPSPPPAPTASWNHVDGRMEASPITATPTSPIRSGRLRGLSYLRNYTSRGHSSSHHRPTFGRATSYPSPTSRGSAASPSASPAPPSATVQQIPSLPAPQVESDVATARSSQQETSTTSTSGWLPSVGGQSGVSRITTDPQSSTTASSSALAVANTSSEIASDLTTPMARTRSATTSSASQTHQASANLPQAETDTSTAHAATNGTSNTSGMPHQLPSIRFAAHQDPRASRPSLVFSPMLRILPTGKETIKVGRYSEREHPLHGQNSTVPSSAAVGFKSKVVSRRHCEFWCTAGRWYIKDVKSSSGTFLNHIRLSSPGTESRPFPVNDGDIVQLGIDFKGGEEMIFRCVKIRVELNKGWQAGPSQFNVQSHKRLRELNSLGKPVASGPSQDCSICLGAIAPCQSLFVAPCSHTWHYKCIRVIINGPHWPHFICPNCRSVADLEAELDEGEWQEGKEGEAEAEAPIQQTATSEVVQATSPVTRPQERSTEDTAAEPASAQAVHTNDVGDMEMGEGSDEAAERLGYMNLGDTRSPSHSPEPEPHPRSNSTVAPVDIIPRKSISGSSTHDNSHLTHPNARQMHNRTPSPNGAGSSLHDMPIVPEGPMTPRNDVGPFIFSNGNDSRASVDRLINGGATLSTQRVPEPTT